MENLRGWEGRFCYSLIVEGALCALCFKFVSLCEKKTQYLKIIFPLSLIVSRGLVPLHNACSYGHYEVAELLVKHGAVVNVADLWKFTPLHEAAAKGKYEICKLLLQVLHMLEESCFLFFLLQSEMSLDFSEKLICVL